MRARCPHCRHMVLAECIWNPPVFSAGSLENYKYMAMRCPNCSEIHIQYATESMFADLPAAFSSDGWSKVAITVHPVDHGREPVPPQVPDEYAKDYIEACAVLQASPQSTATLARRLLQALLQGPGGIPPQKNLAEEIKLAKGTLPAVVWDGLDTLRQMGNFAAHEQRDKTTGVVLPIESHEAEYALDVVERLFDEYFVAPAKMAAAKSKFNASKMTPAGKKPIP